MRKIENEPIQATEPQLPGSAAIAPYVDAVANAQPTEKPRAPAGLRPAVALPGLSPRRGTPTHIPVDMNPTQNADHAPQVKATRTM